MNTGSGAVADGYMLATSRKLVYTTTSGRNFVRSSAHCFCKRPGVLQGAGGGHRFGGWEGSQPLTSAIPRLQPPTARFIRSTLAAGACLASPTPSVPIVESPTSMMRSGRPAWRFVMARILGGRLWTKLTTSPAVTSPPTTTHARAKRVTPARTFPACLRFDVMRENVR